MARVVAATLVGCALLLAVFARPSSRTIIAPVPHALAQSAMVECIGVDIHPDMDIQATVDIHPSNTTFCLQAGVHRITAPIVPRFGDMLIGKPGAIINGSVPLALWTRHAQYWLAHVAVLPHPQPHGICAPDFPGCRHANDLFYDDTPLQRVLTLEDVRPGRYYFDEATGSIFMQNQPRGRMVELAVALAGVRGGSGIDNVVVRGVVVEKIANRAQVGAIDSRGSQGWMIEDNEVRLNHGVGICAGSYSQVRRNFVHHNGQLGLCGNGDQIVVEDNEIAFNNTAGFRWQWEAGGAKWTQTNGLIVRRNHSHDNKGPGLWTDIDNINTLYEGNIIKKNDAAGIIHEISYDAVIRNNVAERNGHDFKDWLWGGGIVIAASPNVEVYGNTVTNNGDGITLVQQNRGIGLHGPHELGLISVHDNTVKMGEGMTGLVQDVNDKSYYTSRNIWFARNIYYLNSSLLQFAWDDRAVTKEEWQAFGHDLLGSFFGLP